MVPERGQGPAELQRIKEAKEKERDEDLSESVYDEFSGYGGSLFKGGEYDQEDKDADLLYQAIDERMESRHSKRRKERTKQEQEALAKAGPTVQDQFKMLKEELKTVSSKEWESLPEAMDLSGRNKQINAARQAALTTHASLSDQLLLAAAAGGQQLVGTIDVKSSSASASTSDGNGYATPVGLGGMVDLTQLGKARDKALGIKLDRAADSTTISSGTATVDAKGYLTDLSSMKSGNGVGDVSDIKKMRMLFKSVISSNPGNAPGWIGAARLERDVGKMSAARELIARGCAACPTNEDIWIEAAALNPTEARAILGKAVQHIPTSVNIWLHAANVEETLEGKRTVIRRALEVLPRSISLWKAAVQLEQPKEARVLLSRAVELIPTALDFWLALAKLETAENARAVLNKARLSIPTEPLIWVAAAQLEEANGNTSRLVMLMQNALTSLAAHKVVMSRESWLQEAIKCETAGSVATCHAIVCVCLGLGIDELDRRNTWMNDAERFTHEGNYETARAVLEQVVSSFPDDEAAWLQAAHLERNHGTPESLANLLAEGCRKCPHSETLWLMTAKAKWVGGDVDGARDVLRDAFSANPNSEEIWLAASKLEFENQEYERSTALLAKARTRASTARVWLKSAKMARVLGHADEEMKLLLEGLERFPAAHKLWIMLAQHHEKAGNVTAARDTYRKGVRACPGAVDLWLCFAAFEGKSGAAADLSRARSVLESARAAIPKNAQIWLASCKVSVVLCCVVLCCAVSHRAILRHSVCCSLLTCLSVFPLRPPCLPSHLLPRSNSVRTTHLQHIS